MRNYRIEAELRDSPDLHQLAQLFISMALDRTEHDRTHHHGSPTSTSHTNDQVES